MDKITERELDSIKGGGTETLSGTVINAISTIIKMIREAGYAIGTGTRRIIENEICPFE